MITGSVIANSPLLYGMIAIGLAIVVVYAIMSVSKATKKCKEHHLRHHQERCKRYHPFLHRSFSGNPAGLRYPERFSGRCMALVETFRYRCSVL